jgi:hypothetical protein
MNNYNPIKAIEQLRTLLFVCRKTLKVSKIKRFEANRLKDHAFNRRAARIILKDLKQYKQEFPEFYAQVIDPRTHTLRA